MAIQADSPLGGAHRILRVLILTVAAASLVHAQSVDFAKATKVKAAYLYNFVKFTKWPESAYADNKAPLVIGVIADEAFRDAVESTVADKTIEGRRLVVRHFTGGGRLDAGELRQCHVLYVSDSNVERWRGTALALRDAPILVVGEGDGFVHGDGLIAFVLAEGNVVFHIDNDAARRSGLQLSSKLLKLAKKVYGKHGE